MQPMFKSKPIAAAVAILAATSILVACGGGSSSVVPTASSGTDVGGEISNSPIDGATIKAVCADGSAGGAGVTTKGSYSIKVTCAATNFPIVISVTGDGTMAGPDMQFGTSDDESYKLSERAPLKVAIENNTTPSANMSAVSTLAAQSIEDLSTAVKDGKVGAIKPTAIDVQAAESKIQTALGITTPIKSASPVTDAQVARLSAQILESVAVTKALGLTAVTPEAVMKAFAQAANTGATGTALVKTETDSSKSFDFAAVQTALTAAAAANPTVGATKSQMDSINTVLNDAKALESAIKAKATAMEQVAKVIAAMPSAQTRDPSKANLASIAGEIKAELAKTENSKANTASINAEVASQAMKQAVAKANEIAATANSTSTDLALQEIANRKKAVFEAAESIRVAMDRDVTSKPASAVWTSEEVARTIAQVSMAVNVTADRIKTAAIGDIVDPSTNKPRASVAGMAEKVRGDIGTQIKTKSVTELGDLKAIVPATVLGATNLASVNTGADSAVAALKDFVPPLAPNGETSLAQSTREAALRVAISTVVGSIASTTDLSTAKNNIQTTITTLANSLNAAGAQTVTVGASTNVALNTLSADDQAKMLAQAAQVLIGSTKLDFSTPPTIGTATTAIGDAATNVGSAVVASLDNPTLSPQTLTEDTSALNGESCSSAVTVTGVNVIVPVKVTVMVNGVAQPISAGDAFSAPPTVGGATTSASGLKVWLKMNDGAMPPVFPNANGVLVGAVNAGQKFALCVKPTDSDRTYAVKAEVGSRYKFDTMEFVDTTKVKTIIFNRITPKTTTTTTTTTTTAAPTTTTTSTTAAPTTTTTSTTAAPTTTTTSTTAAPTTTTTSTTVTTTTTTTQAPVPVYPTLSLAATATNSNDLVRIGTNDAVNFGVAYAGVPVQFGPYVVSGLATPTNVTMFGTLSSSMTMKVNSGAALTSGIVNNGDTVTLLVDMAGYMANTVGGPLSYNTMYSPKIKAGAATITFGNAQGGGILTCGDPLVPPPAGNSICK
ncbi:MAG: hypothetical protein Q8R67_06245 [Rhodoferax sp.]|nr:hypothetical protein [Rhodoferax sp.]MDP3651265.1 hypothetical protein [Rhodoferax sp.]